MGHYYFGSKRIVFEGVVSRQYGVSTSINNYGTYVDKIDESPILFKRQFNLILPRLESEILRNSHAFICKENDVFMTIENDKIAS